MSQFEFEFVADLNLTVVCHGTNSASDATWDAYLAELKSALQKRDRFRSLVVTDGGHPTQSQLNRLKEVTSGISPRVSVISSSTSLRFVVSILALVNRQVKCFDPEQRLAAFSHLVLSPREQQVVEATIERLRQRMALENTTAA